MDDNGLEREGISDLDLCQMWLLSHNFDVFCNTLGAKMGTAEVARKKFDNLRAENARLTAAHEAAADELARVTQELREAVSGRKDAISQAIMDWNLSAPPFPYLNEHAIVDLITVATTALDYAYEK